MLAPVRTTSPTPMHPERHSTISSAASFQTAPTTPSSRSSVLTVGPSNRGSRRESQGDLNPIHLLSQPANGDIPKEVHIVKVTDDAVHLQPGAPPQSLLHKVVRSGAGPPPPSPPASEGHFDEEESLPLKASTSEPLSSYDRPVPRTPRLSFPSPQASPSIAGPSSLPSAASFLRSSSEARAHNYSSGSTISTPHPRAATEGSDDLISDGLLHPPSSSLGRPSRRNTTGSTPRTIKLSARGPSHQTLGMDEADVEGELASDIQQQAEQIRRERQNKANESSSTA